MPVAVEGPGGREWTDRLAARSQSCRTPPLWSPCPGRTAARGGRRRDRDRVGAQPGVPALERHDAGGDPVCHREADHVLLERHQRVDLRHAVVAAVGDGGKAAAVAARPFQDVVHDDVADDEPHAPVGVPACRRGRLMDDANVGPRVDVARPKTGQVEPEHVVGNAVRLVAAQVGQDDTVRRDPGVLGWHPEPHERPRDKVLKLAGVHADALGCSAVGHDHDPLDCLPAPASRAGLRAWVPLTVSGTDTRRRAIRSMPDGPSIWYVWQPDAGRPASARGGLLLVGTLGPRLVGVAAVSRVGALLGRRGRGFGREERVEALLFLLLVSGVLIPARSDASSAPSLRPRCAHRLRGTGCIPPPRQRLDRLAGERLEGRRRRAAPRPLRRSAARPSPAGMSLPMMTFSLRPSRWSLGR